MSDATPKTQKIEGRYKIDGFIATDDKSIFWIGDSLSSSDSIRHLIPYAGDTFAFNAFQRLLSFAYIHGYALDCSFDADDSQDTKILTGMTLFAESAPKEKGVPQLIWVTTYGLYDDIPSGYAIVQQNGMVANPLVHDLGMFDLVLHAFGSNVPVEFVTTPHQTNGYPIASSVSMKSLSDAQ